MDFGACDSVVFTVTLKIRLIIKLPAIYEIVKKKKNEFSVL